MGQPSRAFKSNIGRRSITLVIRLFLKRDSISESCLYTQKLQLSEHFFLRPTRRTIRQLNSKFLKNGVSFWFLISDRRVTCQTVVAKVIDSHGSTETCSPLHRSSASLLMWVSFILSFKSIIIISLSPLSLSEILSLLSLSLPADSLSLSLSPALSSF